MKLTTTSATLILAILASIECAPAAGSSLLSRRDASIIQGYIYSMEDYVEKRDSLSFAELHTRESQIVTDVLTAIKDTNLAPGILEYFISDPTLAPIVEDVVVDLIKSGAINIETLLQSLNDSGLAVSVIQDLISDCSFYSDIYKLALSYIKDLPSLIGKLLGNNSKRELKLLNAQAVTRLVPRATTSSSATEQILTSLMESLKNSGLASQVVRQLIVDPDFLSFGAKLISKLFEENAISLSDLLSDLAESGLVPSLIKAFLNLKTFDTVITNALAAAFGECDGSSVTSAITGSATETATGGQATGSPTTTISTSATITATAVCRKKKRSYHY